MHYHCQEIPLYPNSIFLSTRGFHPVSHQSRFPVFPLEIWVQRGGRKEEEPASGTSPGIWQNHFLLLGYQAKSDELGGTTDHQEPECF